MNYFLDFELFVEDYVSRWAENVKNCLILGVVDGQFGTQYQMIGYDYKHAEGNFMLPKV